jgi:hypothetical protein
MRDWIKICETLSHDGYAYHATFARNIPSIKANGLQIDCDTNFDFSRTGRLYASSLDGAQWYADELGGAYEEEMVILRFPMPDTVQPDEIGNTGDFCFRHPIAAQDIEIESEPGGRFISLSDYK